MPIIFGEALCLALLWDVVQLACFRGWPEGVAAVLAVPTVDPMVPISPSGDTPLHWLCKAGSSWSTFEVNGTSVEVDSAITALVPPGPLKPLQIRGLVTVRPSPLLILPAVDVAETLMVSATAYSASEWLVHLVGPCQTYIGSHDRWGARSQCKTTLVLCVPCKVESTCQGAASTWQGMALTCALLQELAAYKDGAMANSLDCASRTPLFYAHSAAAIEALLDSGVDVNARDCDGLDCVAFRITETMALDSTEFDLSIKDQACLALVHAPPPSHSNARTGLSGKPGLLITHAGFDVGFNSDGLFCC